MSATPPSIATRYSVANTIGALALADLTAADIATWQADLSRKTVTRKRKVNGKIVTSETLLSPRRVKYTRDVLHAALHEAVNLGLIAANPVGRVRPPRQAPKQVNAFNLATVRKLTQAADGTKLRPLVAVAWQTGLRLGELLGLRWADVDFEARTIRVAQNLVYLGAGQKVMQEPKTERGMRTVAMTASVAVELRAQTALQAEERQAAGAGWQDRGLVFTTRDGGPLMPANVRRDFYHLQDKAGIPRQGFHSLRHTKGTLDKAAGVDITEIAANLGHTSPAFTAKTYAHVLPETRREASERFERFIQG